MAWATGEFMKRLTSIVAMSHEGAIGAGNALPWRLRTDLLFFKQQTLNNVVIMGRRTYDSLGRRPLPNRMNIVLTHRYGLFAPAANCTAALSVEEGLWAAEKACSRSAECFVIGGASMYEQFSPYVDRYLITMVDKKIQGADTFVDEAIFNNPTDWDIGLIGAGIADGEQNEANFAILELVSGQAKMISQRRAGAIENAKQAAGVAKAIRSAPVKKRGVPLNVQSSALI